MSLIKRFEMEPDYWRPSVDGFEYPKFKIPQDVSIMITPPFNGADARFRLFLGKKSISFYMDIKQAIGYFGAPYWEAYPINDDVSRAALSDIQTLIDEAVEELRK